MLQAVARSMKISAKRRLVYGSIRIARTEKIFSPRRKGGDERCARPGRQSPRGGKMNNLNVKMLFSALNKL